MQNNLKNTAQKFNLYQLQDIPKEYINKNSEHRIKCVNIMSNYISIEEIIKSNNGKFADVSKFQDGTFCAFHNGNAVTGICKTKKECISDLKDLGYTYTTSNSKAGNI